MTPIDRRNFLGAAGGAGALLMATGAAAQEKDGGAGPTVRAKLPYQEESRARRMKWWHQAKYGMFIHYGLYSIIGHQEWVMESEGIPIPEYEKLAQHFAPKPGAAREWARLAKRAGQKYMVLTTKHHEGFCLWDTKETDYNSVKQGVKRDIVREFLEAARAEGLRVGLYFSLMDWHHPDGARCKDDLAARERFVKFGHAQIRELLTNYGKIDILWYDVDWPLTPEEWRADDMNKMVFDLQPDIIVNNRNGLDGDFGTPEHRITAEARAWESCNTMNYGWGYQRTDHEWKGAKRIVNDLTLCAQQGGNYLLNIGPEADGSVPQGSIDTLEAVGAWLRTNGASIYDCDGRAAGAFGNYTNFTKAGDKLYVHVYFWPSKSPAAKVLDMLRPETVVAVGGVRTKALSARLLKTGEPVKFVQDEISLRFIGLPDEAPDDPTTVIEVTCEGTPYVRHHLIRPEWPRYGVNVGGKRST